MAQQTLLGGDGTTGETGATHNSKANSNFTELYAATAAAQADADAAQTAISDHTSDPISAHAASAIEFTPYGSIIATTVQGAIQEVLDESTAVPDATASVKGITKLYTSTGSSTDGTMDRNSITNAIAGAFGSLNNVALSGGNLTLDWGSDPDKNFDLTTALSTGATIIFSGSGRRKGNLFLRVTGARILTFPSGTYMDLYEKSVGRWDTAGARQLELTGTTASPFMITFDFDALGNAIVHASNRMVTS